MTKSKTLVQIICMSLLLFVAGCAAPDSQDDASEIEELASDSSDSAAEKSEDAGGEENFEEGFDEPPAENQQAQDFSDDSFDEQSPTEATQPIGTTASQAPANRVTAINYLASTNGGTLEIKTSVPAVYSVRPNPETQQYVIEIQNAELAEALKRPFIMKDFDGAFGAVNAYQNPGGRTARIVLQLKSGGSEPTVTQEGLALLVVPAGIAADSTAASVAQNVAPQDGAQGEVGAPTDADSYDVKGASASEKILAARTLDDFLTGSGQFFGRPISIETNSADIRDVIKFIAEESGVNLVIADDVDGKVTVKLRQVPWDQALVIVMLSKGLGYIRQGNVLRITRLATLQAEATAAKEIVESQKVLSPLKVKVMPVSYAAVSELVTQIKPFMSLRGQIVSDTRTSSLILTDTADVLMRVERLIKELDIPPAQVMIEGKIVEASETFTRQMGVNWSLSGSSVDISDSGGLNGSPLRLTPAFSSTSVNQNQVTGQNGAITLSMGTLDFFGNLDASLSLAQTDSLVKIISSPRVVTMNKEKAMISQKGEVITIQSTADQNGNRVTAANRLPIELKLEVTPQITAEGSVVLDVSVLRQFAGADADPGGSTRARPINSREAKTKVLVPNGQTAVVGGIYQSDESSSENGVPFLKDVPVLGWLFKSRSEEKVKTELLLFLTPRILNAKDQSVVN